MERLCILFLSLCLCSWYVYRTYNWLTTARVKACLSPLVLIFIYNLLNFIPVSYIYIWSIFGKIVVFLFYFSLFLHVLFLYVFIFAILYSSFVTSVII